MFIPIICFPVLRQVLRTVGSQSGLTYCHSNCWLKNLLFLCRITRWLLPCPVVARLCLSGCRLVYNSSGIGYRALIAQCPSFLLRNYTFANSYLLSKVVSLTMCKWPNSSITTQSPTKPLYLPRLFST